MRKIPLKEFWYLIVHVAWRVAESRCNEKINAGKKEAYSSYVDPRSSRLMYLAAVITSDVSDMR